MDFGMAFGRGGSSLGGIGTALEFEDEDVDWGSLDLTLSDEPWLPSPCPTDFPEPLPLSS